MTETPAAIAANEADTPALYTHVSFHENSLRCKDKPTAQIRNQNGQVFSKEGLMREWKQWKPTLVSIKKHRGGELTTRTLTKQLLRTGGDLPAGTYPNLRTLLRIMLVIPASSAQSERDFSVQVRRPPLTPAVRCCPQQI